MIFEQVIKFIVARKTQRYSGITILQKLFKIAVECRLSGSVLKYCFTLMTLKSVS